MAYVAACGGEQAIQQAEQLFRQLNGELDADMVQMIEQRMPYMVDRVMGEGSLYAPQLAALALASTQPRLAYAAPVDPAATQTLRRISAAFKDIPGGQILGPTLDYSHRLLRTDLLAQNEELGIENRESRNAEPASDAESSNSQFAIHNYLQWPTGCA